MSAGALEAILGAIDQGGDADDVLRVVVEALAAEPAIDWAGIRFVEDGQLVLGPSAGAPDETVRTLTTIAYRGEAVGELVVDGDVGRALLEDVAALISPYVLLGWDTGGAGWEP